MLDCKLIFDKKIPDAVLRLVLKKFDCIPVVVLKTVDCTLRRCMKLVDCVVAVDVKRFVRVDPNVLK